MANALLTFVRGKLLFVLAQKFRGANLLITSNSTTSSLPDVQIMICITPAHNASWLVIGILSFTKIGLGSRSKYHVLLSNQQIIIFCPTSHSFIFLICIFLCRRKIMPWTMFHHPIVAKQNHSKPEFL